MLNRYVRETNRQERSINEILVSNRSKKVGRDAVVQAAN